MASPSERTVRAWGRHIGRSRWTVQRRLKKLGKATGRCTLKKNLSGQLVASEEDVWFAFPELAEELIEAGKFSETNEQLDEFRVCVARLTGAIRSVSDTVASLKRRVRRLEGESAKQSKSGGST